MRLQKHIPLKDLYDHENQFSENLANHLDALGMGQFEDPEMQADVGRKKADIVATAGDDEMLVIENQFGKADWNHWGRLEMYARLKRASVAVLVAEEFEDSMVDTCWLRNQDSDISWFLIKVTASSHKELSFHHVVAPSVYILAERDSRGEEIEFWKPIREGEYGALFTGKPVRERNRWSISKRIPRRNMRVSLYCRTRQSYARVYFKGPESLKRRKAFIDSNYRMDGVKTDFKLSDDSAKGVYAHFPVMDKGQNNEEHWDEIRRALAAKGEELYRKCERWAEPDDNFPDEEE